MVWHKKAKDLKKCKRYPAESMTNTNYADNLALIANRPANFESLLHRLEHAARDVSLYINAIKIGFVF